MPVLRPILLVLLLAGPARADGPEVAGPPETAFDWATQRCATWDIPDAPARAWRGRDGLVRLLAGSAASRVSVGPDLGRLGRHCGVVHRGAGLDDPGLYDDRTWTASPWIGAGGEVVALAHVEHHGHLRPGACEAGTYAACWRNAIVEVTSTDGGESFRRQGGGRDLVAALPYRYDPAQVAREGYFNPSNVVERDGHLHAFVFAEAYGAQARGACLIRRPVGGGPADWRAWDGSAFAVRFADPYREEVADPAAHACAPLPGLSSTVSSVVWHPGRGLYIAVTPAARRDADGRERSGLWWTTSPDLLTWGEPRLLIELPLLWARDCGAEAAYAYPSLLDEDAPSPNFETVDEDFWLYAVRMRVGEGCEVGPERDLVRWPVNWPAPAADGSGP